MSEADQLIFDALRSRPPGPSAAARPTFEDAGDRYHCRVCLAYFSEAGYTAHLHSSEHVHSVNCLSTLYCSLCRKLFNNPWELNMHISSRLHQLAADEARRSNN